MNLSAGERLGPYEIIERIGAGGMGEVYRARDTRLGREVATKISAERFSERFEREARAIASLNHPNICQLYDVGENYLVMELVEGEAPQGPLPLETALNYARQIADALASAHEKGIVHRDLKPANIKIKPDGQVKVLDFGLAKVGWTNVPADTQNSPTLSLAATQAGVILGTAAYMAPEQAKGRSVDKRADIWAFGVVFYEMLTGRQLFDGDDVTEVLASVVKEQPDLSRVPFQVRRLLSACLEKDPNKRLRDVSDVWRLLDEPEAGRPASAQATTPLRSFKYGWWAVALLFLALIPANLIHWRETPAAGEVVRFQISGPEKSRLNNSIALSPDGRKIVFQARGDDGNGHLWVRSLDNLDAKIIAEVQGTAFPFWSPDSRYIAYQDGLTLKKVEAAGGTPQDICNVPGTIVGGTWSPEGVIVFGNAAGSPWKGLFKVSANGGMPSQLTSLDTSKHDAAHILPAFLPDGRHFIYVRFSIIAAEGGTYIGSIDETPEKQPVREIVRNQSTILFSPVLAGSTASSIGYLVYLREATLVAQAFDTRTLDFAGEAIPIANPVGRSANGAIGLFSVSQTGALIYRTDSEEGTNQITWLGRDGKTVSNPAPGAFATFGDQGNYTELNLSPNMQSAVMAAGGAARRDIYSLDLTRNINSRFTFDPADDRSPVWSPDAQQVVFSSNRDGQGDLYIKASNGARNEEMLYKSSEPKTANDWSRDRRFLLFTVVDPKTRSDIWYLTMTGERKAMPFLQNPYNEGLAQFSPDGRFVAYLSDESGSPEIYVRSFPDANGKWQISKGGGVDPRWRGDGKEIVYLSGRRVMAVDVTSTPTFTPGTPKLIFEAPIVQAGTFARNPGYSVSADGKNFLANMPVGQNASRPITVVLNWQAALKK